MGSLQIKDLFLGKIDAYNEFVEFGNEACKNYFFEFPNIEINSLLNGKYYYVCGEKGTGKTMLLKYLETLVDSDNSPSYSTFIRFMRNIDDEQRNQIKRIGTTSTEDNVDYSQPIDTSVDCVLAWEIYLIKTVIFGLEKTEYGTFQRDEIWDELTTILHSLYDEKIEKKRLRTIIPKIKKGNVELNIATLGKVKLDLEWVNPEKTTVSFKSIANKILDLFSCLSPCENKYYVFVDELELSLRKNKQYERDIILIRDLVLAIYQLSEISKENEYNVHYLAAIRNEVYQAVQSIGLEINKPIHDYGIQLSWVQNGGNIKDNPLLKMLEKRIHYSEEKQQVQISTDIWDTYFSSVIHEKNICNYILEQTWNKPRDIIRLFTIIQKKYGDRSIIDQEIFDGVRQDYSSESWDEKAEALSAFYSNEEIEGIRLVLTGIIIPFDAVEFSNHIDSKSECYDVVEKLKNSKYKPIQILSLLYNVGVVGNYEKVPRFEFKGDRDIDPSAAVTIHYPLIKFFKASMKEFERR